MPISDPQAIRFTNEKVRPLCEQVRALKATIDATTVEWFATQSSLITNNSEAVADGREAEGVSRLTGADVTSVITQLLAIQTTLNAGGVAAVISKPCVQPLRVS